MGNLKFGTNSPLALYMGVSGSTKAYYGTTEVFSGGGTDYSTLYTTMEILTGGTIELNSNLGTKTISYSLDDGSSWVSAVSGNSITVSAGDKVLWKGTNTSYGTTKSIFTSDAYFNVFGNVMSLLYGDNFTWQTVVYEAGLQSLFKNLNIVEASNFVLPATSLTPYCYYNMFEGCTSLTAAPALPATSLASNCYTGMFSGCTSLTAAHALPATSLDQYCYYGMFAGCTSLTAAPALPATSLTQNCYSTMFSKCSSLTAAPELPALELASSCYRNMFSGCTSLTAAPALPATSLTSSCYYGMFYGCSSLTAAPELPAEYLVTDCYRNMFSTCTSLSYIKCLATNNSGTAYTRSWVRGVPSGGTFVKHPDVTWQTGDSGIPSGWTVIDA